MSLPTEAQLNPDKFVTEAINNGITAIEALNKRLEQSEARVQLLAKALLYIKGNAEAAGGSEAVYMFPDDKRLEDYISEVLAEAGLDKEPA
jgi:hypothetical protein